MSSDQVGTPHVKAGSNVQLGCTLPPVFYRVQSDTCFSLLRLSSLIKETRIFWQVRMLSTVAFVTDME